MASMMALTPMESVEMSTPLIDMVIGPAGICFGAGLTSAVMSTNGKGAFAMGDNRFAALDLWTQPAIVLHGMPSSWLRDRRETPPDSYLATALNFIFKSYVIKTPFRCPNDNGRDEGEEERLSF